MAIIEAFEQNRSTYGTRRIKVILSRAGKIASRRKIGRIMAKHGLVSVYTVAQFKPLKDKCNNSQIENIVDRKFNDKKPCDVVVSDLTYVRVGNKWNYICTLIDLFDRRIIGYSVGNHKNAELVKEAFGKVQGNLKNIKIFHTDRGNEFKNRLIDETLNAFNITRSLSRKGSPHDNAVAEATFKTIKTEFVKCNTFDYIQQLRLHLADYVHWYNHHRLHSRLGYMSPMEYSEAHLTA